MQSVDTISNKWHCFLVECTHPVSLIMFILLQIVIVKSLRHEPLANPRRECVPE